MKLSTDAATKMSSGRNIRMVSSLPSMGRRAHLARLANCALQIGATKTSHRQHLARIIITADRAAQREHLEDWRSWLSERRNDIVGHPALHAMFA